MATLPPLIFICCHRWTLGILLEYLFVFFLLSWGFIMHRIWNWHIITYVEILRAECCSALSGNDNHEWWVYSAGGGQEGLLLQGTFLATSHYASIALSLQITAGERQSRGDWGSPIPCLSLRWPSCILLSPSHSGWMTLILSWFQIKSHTGVHSSLSSSLLSPSLSLSLSLSLSS